MSAAWINSLPPETRKTILDALHPDEASALARDWRFWARPEQVAPEGAWRIWLFLGGRGAGKTRAGAEWVCERVREGARRVGLVGATYADARDVMIAGESGILSIARGAAVYEPSKRAVRFANGAVAYVFTAEEPDGLRGHQLDASWCDEYAKWREPQTAFDMLMMALRSGDDPRCTVTTTPRAIPALKSLLAMKGVAVTRASTFANAANLAPAFLDQMRRIYAGTRLGRQELNAELIEAMEAAIGIGALRVAGTKS